MGLGPCLTCSTVAYPCVSSSGDGRSSSKYVGSALLVCSGNSVLVDSGVKWSVSACTFLVIFGSLYSMGFLRALTVLYTLSS